MGIFKFYKKLITDMVNAPGELAEILRKESDGSRGIKGMMVNPLIKSFICPHCLKSIVIEKINYIICPHCDSKNEVSRIALVAFCLTCGDPIKYYKCPYCKKGIDLDAPYDRKALQDKRTLEENNG